MILGIGVDSVEIKRFEKWFSYNRKILRRIFSEQEIEYCLQTPTKKAERFAARFAAREAFFKAFSMYQPDHTLPFLTMCRFITVEKNKNNSPNLIVDWEQMVTFQLITPLQTLLTLSHTQQIATAFVVLQSTLKSTM